jgi:hypothetical protein
MDLIAEIIKRKNTTPTDALEVIKRLITDIITYEKLAQNKRFQDIQNPVVAKRCPDLYKTSTEVGYESALLRELLPVLISFTNRSYATLELEERTIREEILDASYSIHLTVQDGRLYTEDDENQLVLREPNIEDPDRYDYLVIKATGQNVHAYMFRAIGTSANVTIEPVVVSRNGDIIGINSYSRLGNNDYPFGRINDKPIRIINGTLYVDKQPYVLESTVLALKTDIEDIAEYLLSVYQEGKNNGSSR